MLPSQVEPRLDKKTNGVSTYDSPDSQNVHKSTNDTSIEDINNITTSDNDNEEEEESISPNTSYSTGMHTSGEDTDGEDDTNLLTTDEDSDERNQTNQDVEGNNSTEQQNNGTTLQENVRDQKRENPHTDTLQLGKEESPE